MLIPASRVRAIPCSPHFMQTLPVRARDRPPARTPNRARAQASAALEWWDDAPASGPSTSSLSAEVITSHDLERQIKSRGRSHADIERNFTEGEGDGSGGRGGSDKLTASGELRRGWWKVCAVQHDRDGTIRQSYSYFASRSRAFSPTSKGQCTPLHGGLHAHSMPLTR